MLIIYRTIISRRVGCCVVDDARFDLKMRDGKYKRGVERSYFDLAGSDDASGGASASDSGSGSGGDDGFTKGAKVLGNYKGRGKWFKGRIARCNRDGTFDLDYADGDEEKKVKRRYVKLPDKDRKKSSKKKAKSKSPRRKSKDKYPSDTDEEASSSDAALARDDRVECNYKGESNACAEYTWLDQLY